MDNSSKHKGFRVSKEAPNKWEYWEKLNPKIRKAMQNHPIDFNIFATWKLQKEHGVKHVLQRLNTRALELTVCDVPPLGVDYRWVTNGENLQCHVN